MPLAAPRDLAFEHAVLVDPHGTTLLRSSRTERFEYQPSTHGALAPTFDPFPTWLLRRYGGATFYDSTQVVTGGLVDVNIYGGRRQANGPDLYTVAVANSRDDLAALFVDDDQKGLTPADGVTFELEIDGVLQPRLNVSGVNDGDRTMDVTLADRRYETSCREVGRVGDPPNLTPSWVDGLSGWTSFGSPTETPYPGGGAGGPTDTSALQITGNTGANGWTATVAPAAVPFSREIGYSSWLYLPSGAWAPSDEGFLGWAQITDLDTAVVIATPSTASGFALAQDSWISQHSHVTIPAGKRYSIEFRMYAQNGSILVEDFNTFMTEGLFWTSADTGQIVRDLIAHSYDYTMGQADTGLRATTASVPDTGIIVSRVILTESCKQISTAIGDALNMSGAWSWLEAQSDGSDLFHADPGGDLVAFEVTDTNTVSLSWQWAGDNHADVLKVFSPDSTSYLEQRLIKAIGPEGVFNVRGAPSAFGRVRSMVGPYGSYDSRVISALLDPFYNAMKLALAATVTVKDPAAMRAYADGSLRPGALVDCRTGHWPRSLIGRCQVVEVGDVSPLGDISLILNRIAV